MGSVAVGDRYTATSRWAVRAVSIPKLEVINPIFEPDRQECTGFIEGKTEVEIRPPGQGYTLQGGGARRYP